MLHFIGTLICISLICCDIKHHLTVYVSSSGKHPLSSFVYFLIRSLISLILSFFSSLCALDISSLVDMFVIFSYHISVPSLCWLFLPLQRCLFTLLTVSLAMQKFFICCDPFSLLLPTFFRSCPKIDCSDQHHGIFPLYFLLVDFYMFKFYVFYSF